MHADLDVLRAARTLRPIRARRRRRFFMSGCVFARLHRLLLVEMLACSWEARELLIQDIFFGAHAVTFHVLCPVELTHVEIEHLQNREKDRRQAFRRT